MPLPNKNNNYISAITFVLLKTSIYSQTFHSFTFCVCVCRNRAAIRLIQSSTNQKLILSGCCSKWCDCKFCITESLLLNGGFLFTDMSELTWEWSHEVFRLYRSIPAWHVR